MTSSSPNPFDNLAIRNILSQYCMVVDDRDFASLKHVFAPDVVVAFPFATRTGVDQVRRLIEQRLVTVTTQHAITTQTIHVAKDGKSATATSYFTGAHWGAKGTNSEGKNFTVSAKYIDTLARLDGDVDEKYTIPGASEGHWVITRRDIVFMGSTGDDSIMGEATE